MCSGDASLAEPHPLFVRCGLHLRESVGVRRRRSGRRAPPDGGHPLDGRTQSTHPVARHQTLPPEGPGGAGPGPEVCGQLPRWHWWHFPDVGRDAAAAASIAITAGSGLNQPQHSNNIKLLS